METDTETLGSSDVPRARNSDPATSHAAARSVEDLTFKQTAVLRVIEKHPGIHDQTLVKLYERYVNERVPFLGGVILPQQTESGIRTRRNELAKKDLIEKAGKKRLPSGRMAETWRKK